MTDKQVNAWLRRRFSTIGWLLLLFYGLMTALTSITAWVDMAKQFLLGMAAGDYRVDFDWNAINSNAWGYIAAMLVGFAVLDAWKGREYRERILFAKHAPMKGRTFLCLLIFCMGAQMASTFWITLLELLMAPLGKSVMPMLESVAGSSDTVSMFLYASVLAPVWEELLFRGWILRSLQPYGKRFSIVCSALLFGLFHGNLLQTPYAILMGLLFGYVTVEYSLVWAMALHMFNNFVLADLLTRLTAGWSEMACGTLNLVLFGGSAVVSVLILAANRSEICAYRNAEWIDRRCLKCFFTSPGIMIMTASMLFSMVVTLFA